MMNKMESSEHSVGEQTYSQEQLNGISFFTYQLQGALAKNPEFVELVAKAAEGNLLAMELEVPVTQYQPRKEIMLSIKNIAVDHPSKFQETFDEQAIQAVKEQLSVDEDYFIRGDVNVRYGYNTDELTGSRTIPLDMDLSTQSTS